MSTLSPFSPDQPPFQPRRAARFQDLRLPALVRRPPLDTAPFEAVFAYDPQDPLAVRMGLYSPTALPVSWVFSRDLLLAGLHAPVGVGDVQVHPRPHPPGRPAGLVIVLRRPGNRVEVEVVRAELGVWLRGTVRRIPLQSETGHLDLDVTLARLLRPGYGP